MLEYDFETNRPHFDQHCNNALHFVWMRACVQMSLQKGFNLHIKLQSTVYKSLLSGKIND